MTGRLEGKVALVTGGSSGIGRASAQVCAREGARVVVAADSNIAGGEETVKLIKEAGGEAIFVKTDVKNAVEVEALVNKAVQKYGRLDCALNNAGIEGILTLIVDDTEENWNNVVDTNLKGVWLCMKYEIAYMSKHGGGAIVNISSMSGHRGTLRCMPYVASKHGVIGLTKAATLEYANQGIRINAVCPGPSLTPMSDRIADVISGGNPGQFMDDVVESIPIGRWGTPEDAAEAIAWLFSDAASFVTGHILSVDGGFLAGH